MSEIVAVPTYVLEEIDRKLTAALPDEAADEDRAALKAELLRYVDEHGVVPDFDVVRPEAGGEEGETDG